MSGMNLSRVRQFTEGFQAYGFHVGLDVHKLTYHVALRRVDGSAETWVCTSDPVKLRNQLQSLKIPIDACLETQPFKCYRKWMWSRWFEVI